MRATGVHGNFAAPAAHNAHWDRVSLRRTQRLSDVTAFGDDDDVFEGTGRGGSVRAEGTTKYNAAAASPGFDAVDGSGGSFTVTFAPSCTVTGTVIVEDLGGDIDRKADNRITLAGRLSGGLVETWDETSA